MIGHMIGWRCAPSFGCKQCDELRAQDTGQAGSHADAILEDVRRGYLDEATLLRLGVVPVEPQEGAPINTVDFRGVQAPSCDSAELAAMRARVELGADPRYAIHVWGDRCALLRMVDQLTAKLELYRSSQKRLTEAWENSEQALTFEKKCSDDHREAFNAAAIERDELRAKLSEAERERACQTSRADGWHIRAEAAEARVRELEAAVTTARSHINRNQPAHALNALETVVCVCSTSNPLDYEGPSRDCPVHGERP